MSPELKKYYSTKQRRMAFYIVENEINNEETPPEVSAIIGLDKELEAAFYAARRPLLDKNEKPDMSAGIRVNREITSTNKPKKEDKDTVKKNISKKNGMHCPSLPTQWINNMNVVIPRAQFGLGH